MTTPYRRDLSGLDPRPFCSVIAPSEQQNISNFKAKPQGENLPSSPPRATRWRLATERATYLLLRYTWGATSAAWYAPTTWSHLERLEGAIGTHGCSETQLETDRLIRNKIRHLKQQLEEVRRHRALYRQRACHGVPVVWLVGSTNAGREIRFRPLPPPGQLAKRRPLSRRLER